MENILDLEQYELLAAEFTGLGLEYGLNLLTAVLILIAGFTIGRWVYRLIRRRLEAIGDFDRTLIPVISKIARYTILVFTFVLVLAEFGVQTTSIIAVLGAAGLAIGLALQGTLQNVAAGMMLLFLRPFQIGDFIEAGSVSGTVDEIGMFVTRMNTVDGVFVSVPNSAIWSESIVNYSRNPERRMDIVVGISYDDDIDKARDVLLKLARDDKRVLEEPEPFVLVNALGNSSVDLELRAWAKREDFWNVKWDLTREIKYALDKAGISIPYPHMQVITSRAS